MGRRLRVEASGGKQVGDQIISEVAMAALMFTDGESDISFDIDGFERMLRSKGYTIRKTNESVTFTIVDA
jgi:hypothetical protein